MKNEYCVFPKKPISSSGCAAAIKFPEINDSYNQITEDMERYLLKDIFQPLISQLCIKKWRIKEQGIYFGWFPRINCTNMYYKNHLW